MTRHRLLDAFFHTKTVSKRCFNLYIRVVCIPNTGNAAETVLCITSMKKLRCLLIRLRKMYNNTLLYSGVKR